VTDIEAEAVDVLRRELRAKVREWRAMAERQRTQLLLAAGHHESLTAPQLEMAADELEAIGRKYFTDW
jgi:hypothetical protein